MKPLALDLCCGKGGWTLGLLDSGWDVIGVDIEDMGGYPTNIIFADVREIAKDPEKYFPALKFDLVVASPPCQEFSYRSFPFKRCRELAKNVPPDKSIWQACEVIAKKLGCALIIENVRGAQPYMGKAQWHYGAFYLWGNLPALMPIGNPRKGFGGAKEWKDRMKMHNARKGTNEKRIFAGEYERENGLKPIDRTGQFATKRDHGKQLFKDMDHSKHASRSKVRKEWSATIAMIPIELSKWIGECFYPREAFNGK